MSTSPRMRSLTRTFVSLALGALLLAGCSGDVARQLTSDPNLQVQVMDMITGNGGMASQMADRLITSDTTRAMLVDKLLSNGDAAQSLMLSVAKNSSMLDGVIGLAVQDPATKDHVLALLKGIEMAGGATK